MPLISEQLPPVGQEVVFKKQDNVLLFGIRQQDETYTVSLPDEDSSIALEELVEWYFAT